MLKKGNRVLFNKTSSFHGRFGTIHKIIDDYEIEVLVDGRLSKVTVFTEEVDIMEQMEGSND